MIIEALKLVLAFGLVISSAVVLIVFSAHSPLVLSDRARSLGNWYATIAIFAAIWIPDDPYLLPLIATWFAIVFMADRLILHSKFFKRDPR